MRSRLLLFALVSSSALAQQPPDPRRRRPDHERTPFAAEQIRAGCRAGRISVLRAQGGDKAEPKFQEFRFIDYFHRTKLAGAAFHAFNAIKPEATHGIDRARFVETSGIKDRADAARAFAWFDRDADGKLGGVEFLTTWIDWTGPKR